MHVHALKAKVRCQTGRATLPCDCCRLVPPQHTTSTHHLNTPPQHTTSTHHLLVLVVWWPSPPPPPPTPDSGRPGFDSLFSRGPFPGSSQTWIKSDLDQVRPGSSQTRIKSDPDQVRPGSSQTWIKSDPDQVRPGSSQTRIKSDPDQVRPGSSQTRIKSDPDQVRPGSSQTWIESDQWLQNRYSTGFSDSKFDLQLVLQCGGTSNCLGIFVPEKHCTMLGLRAASKQFLLRRS